MKTKALRILAIILLLFVGTGAVYGGYALMKDPTGALIQLPYHFILNSPFTDYYIPGLILFIANGLLSFLTAAACLWRWKYYPLMVFMQGAIIVGWIVIQIIMIKVFFWLQFVLAACGAALAIAGYLLRKQGATQAE